MKRAELALRKELALTRLRIARTEIALARSQKPDSLATVNSAVELLSTIVAGRPFGKWTKYLKLALGVVQLGLKVRRIA